MVQILPVLVTTWWLIDTYYRNVCKYRIGLHITHIITDREDYRGHMIIDREDSITHMNTDREDYITHMITDREEYRT